MVLNTPGGVVDLRTGELRRAQREDYCSKATSVTPDGECPQWHAFLDRITNGDGQLQGFMRRVAGLCLTGLVSEHAMFFGHGTGSNGKGVFIRAITCVMGDYAVVAPIETFTENKTDRHPTELARLRGARLVTIQETERGRHWAESRIKELTGGDPIAARFMRCDFFEYEPQFKLFVIGNYKPALRGVNEAIRRRMNLIPFNVTIPEQERDEHLDNKLRAEWPGILQWMIQGCIEWQRVGLNQPEIVRTATEDYLKAEDAIGNWVNECCVILGPKQYGFTKPLFASWTLWADAAGEPRGSEKKFVADLEQHGFTKGRDSATNTSVIYGLGLKAPAEPEQQYWQRE